MKEQVQDIEFFPKDPTKIEPADLAGRKILTTGTTTCVLSHIKDLTLCSSLLLY